MYFLHRCAISRLSFKPRSTTSVSLEPIQLTDLFETDRFRYIGSLFVLSGKKMLIFLSSKYQILIIRFQIWRKSYVKKYSTRKVQKVSVNGQAVVYLVAHDAPFKSESTVNRAMSREDRRAFPSDNGEETYRRQSQSGRVERSSATKVPKETLFPSVQSRARFRQGPVSSYDERARRD